MDPSYRRSERRLVLRKVMTRDRMQPARQDRQIHEEPKQPIVQRPLEREIVRKLVDGEQESMVDDAAK